MEKVIILLSGLTKGIFFVVPFLGVALVVMFIGWFVIRLITRKITGWRKGQQKKKNPQNTITVTADLPPPPEPEPPREYIHYFKLLVSEHLNDFIFPCDLEFGRLLIGAELAATRKQLEANGVVFYFNDPKAEIPGLEVQTYESRIGGLEKVIAFLRVINEAISDKQAVVPKDMVVTLKTPNRTMYNCSMTLRAGSVIEIIIEEGDHYLVKVVKNAPNSSQPIGHVFFLEKVQFDGWRQLFSELLPAAEKSQQKYSSFLPDVYMSVDRDIAYIKELIERAEAAAAASVEAEPAKMETAPTETT